MKTGRIEIKRTGEWFWYYARLSWGKIEYSFDEINWFPSKSAAFRDAAQQGLLQPAPPCTH